MILKLTILREVFLLLVLWVLSDASFVLLLDYVLSAGHLLIIKEKTIDPNAQWFGFDPFYMTVKNTWKTALREANTEWVSSACWYCAEKVQT